MAAKKKKKAKKGSKPAKAKKAPAKKAKAKKVAKPATKKAKKAKKTTKKSVKAAVKKAPAKKAKKATKKKQTVGEGDYAASRSFLKDQSSFVEKNKAKIPALGQEAEKALEGPEGASLREAEATAGARSRDQF
jgi:hypothetical protein